MTLVVSATIVPIKEPWTRLGLQTVQTGYRDHCSSSAIPGQGIESLLPTFGVALIVSIIQTEEEQTAAGTRCNSPTYIIRMHL
jgi:hypothetical protein